MPTSPNYGWTYITPLDPAYAGLWGPPVNTFLLNIESELVTRTADMDFADFDLKRPKLQDYCELATQPSINSGS